MTRSNGRVGKWWVAFALVLGMALVSGPASAEFEGDGPGTKFLECRDTAHDNYNTCLVTSISESDKYACDFAWGMDLIACDIELVGSTIGKLFSWWK
jgi:hypothetical protein